MHAPTLDNMHMISTIEFMPRIYVISCSHSGFTYPLVILQKDKSLSKSDHLLQLIRTQVTIISYIAICTKMPGGYLGFYL